MSLDTERRLYALEEDAKRRKTMGETAGGSGAAFPTGISAGFRFFRTDLGFACYYDGTRWLTENEYSVGRYFDTPAAGTYIIAPLHGLYAPYITRRATVVRTSATNTAVNYWNVTILGVDSAQAATTTVDVATTAAQAASTWATGSAVPSATSTPTNNAALDLNIAATGVPSILTAIGVTVFYRLIIT